MSVPPLDELLVTGLGAEAQKRVGGRLDGWRGPEFRGEVPLPSLVLEIETEFGEELGWRDSNLSCNPSFRAVYFESSNGKRGSRFACSAGT